MSQPVKISEALLLDARMVGETVERSIAGQIELWARLGRALEPLLRGDQMLALCRADRVRPLSACLAAVDSDAGRQSVRDYLQTRPFPHYEAAAQPGLLVRIEADGRRTVGRFVNREFQPVTAGKTTTTKPPAKLQPIGRVPARAAEAEKVGQVAASKIDRTVITGGFSGLPSSRQRKKGLRQPVKGGS